MKPHAIYLVMLGMLPLCIPASAPAEAPATKPLAEFKASSGVHRMALSPDGKHLALGIEDGPLIVLDAATLQSRGPAIKIQGGRAECLAFTPDSTTLATGTFEGAYTLWKIPGGAVERRINAQGLAGAVGFTGDGRGMVTYPTDSDIGTWDVTTGAKRGTVPLTGAAKLVPREVVFSADTKTLAISGVTDNDHTVRV